MNGTERPEREETRTGTMRSLYERPLRSLFGDLSREAVTLVRQELDYAKTEMVRKLTGTVEQSGLFMAGTAVLYAGFLFILAAVVIVLSHIIPLSLSAFLVGLAVSGAGWLLMRSGRKKLQEGNMVPQQTIENLERDKEWIKKQVM